MRNITFIDTEIDPKTHQILDLGAIKSDGTRYHGSSTQKFAHFIRRSEFICGHNLLRHDIKYVGDIVLHAGIPQNKLIDTLFLSPLLFPAKPYHKLLKDDKLQTEELNNPLNDSIKAMELFGDEINAFNKLNHRLKDLYFLLLGKTAEFTGFFKACDYPAEDRIPVLARLRRTLSQGGTIPQVRQLINDCFAGHVCENADIDNFIENQPVALSYALALINTYIPCDTLHSLTPAWVLKNYPEVEWILHKLRNTPCIQGCPYCRKASDVHAGLKKFFGFSSFRTYAGAPLQEQAVKAAVDGKSLLAVFPTGGGKSITFQLPALISGENMRGLTVVISPLQSLMKDQVDNLEKRGITEAVTINGLLDPIERAKAFERVADGSASILYIAPESLRSKSIERLLLGRTISRFVIDEAHCFSSWGQDFRVDYLYIGDFIKSLQEKKNLQESIPVSCFTATAKLKVIEDIRSYFKEKLSLELDLFTTNAARSNLLYRVIKKETDEEKYNAVRSLIEEKDCPTIVYVSRTMRAESIAEKLRSDGFNALEYHGKMSSEDKSKNQNAFISGEVQVMVATSAFGMGVDKKDVGLVIHYDISDSLENYVQEAGRAGRDESISAECYVLYNDEDLSKHFILLNQTKLTIKEIQQIWKAVKELTRYRSKVSNSALEIARKAGWDDSVGEIETRVTTAIAALEDAGYLKREQNSPQVFATSIQSKSAQEAIDKINASDRFDQKEKVNAVRIIKSLISSRSCADAAGDDGESRIDYLSDRLGIPAKAVIRTVNLLKEEKILADDKDLTVFIVRKDIERKDSVNRSRQITVDFNSAEKFLLPQLDMREKVLNIKELNQRAEESGLKSVDLKRLKILFNIWAIRKWLKYQFSQVSPNHVKLALQLPPDAIKAKMSLCQDIALFAVEYLYEKNSAVNPYAATENTAVNFSEKELKEAFEGSITCAGRKVSLADIEDALFYLSRIEAIKIDGGFLVIYNRLTLQRLCMDNKRRYRLEDYQKLANFYESKTQQIHIVGEYAKKMLDDYQSALQFVDDYFHLNYTSFLTKYFKGKREEICRNMTPAKFRQLFGELSPRQLSIIKDQNAKYIVVAAGPGSGKTRILVHKLASLLLMEDVKHEQLLMLTFSRAAAIEFKVRLLKLIGNAASFVEIKTFHSYCFDILGQVGNVEKSEEIIRVAIEKIRNNEVDISRITKTVLVIDEAQDMDQDDYDIVKLLMEKNEEMRVIAVGDDDQNIYGFRGSDSRYMEMLLKEEGAVKYELTENYRSRANLVEFAGIFAGRITGRLKTSPITAKNRENGKLQITKYISGNLIVPAAEVIASSDLAGSTCVLTRTNDEALQLSALLLDHGIPSRLIQSNEGFELSDLDEIRYFIEAIGLSDSSSFLVDEGLWARGVHQMKAKFLTSDKLDLCLSIVNSFAAANPVRKYKSDFRSFLDESAVEDFYMADNEIINVSTMHKAKGKEFDNVFLVLDRYQLTSNEERRLLYVAMTRAKQNLYILENDDIFKSARADGLEFRIDRSSYGAPERLAVNLTHRDVYLGYFEYHKNTVNQFFAGDRLGISADGCTDLHGKTVIRFSKAFLSKISDFEAKGYSPSEAKVNFALWWYDKDKDSQVKILLPSLVFSKNSTSKEIR